ncbi:MAG: MltA domain-containing protein [Thermodesulfobacteriota bacterium]
MSRISLWLQVVVLLVWAVPGAAAADGFVRVTDGDRLQLLDDGDPEDLGRALANSLRYFAARREAGGSGAALAQIAEAGAFAEAAARFAALREQLSPGEIGRRWAEHFDLYQWRQGLLVTGYFEPELRGSLCRDGTFRYPLFGVPADLDDSGRRSWRRQERLLYSYPSRGQIEEQGLLSGQELLWVDDAVARFILHVQGSGRVRLPDGEILRLQYAGNNGRPYRSIGRLLVEQGVMELNQVSMPRIEEYLRARPEEAGRLMQANDRYIFFRASATGLDVGPAGSLGYPLVAGRSVAADPAVYPAGALAFLVTTQPRFAEDGRLSGWVSLRRFVTIQDAGAAITGPGRLDFFWGAGTYAARAAGIMKQPGRLYLLVPKGSGGT